MKTLLILALAMAPFFAATSAPRPGGPEETGGIITPDVATGMFSTDEFTNDMNGNMVVCVRPGEYSSGKCSGPRGSNHQWTRIQDAIPPGRVFVGFKVVSGHVGYRRIEVYWK